MTPPQGGTVPGAPTPGIAVLGWLLVAFAIVPLAMAVKGDGTVYGWIGGAAVGLAVVLIGAARWRSTKS